MEQSVTLFLLSNPNELTEFHYCAFKSKKSNSFFLKHKNLYSIPVLGDDIHCLIFLRETDTLNCFNELTRSFGVSPFMSFSYGMEMCLDEIKTIDLSTLDKSIEEIRKEKEFHEALKNQLLMKVSLKEEINNYNYFLISHEKRMNDHKLYKDYYTNELYKIYGKSIGLINELYEYTKSYDITGFRNLLFGFPCSYYDFVVRLVKLSFSSHGMSTADGGWIIITPLAKLK